MNLTNDGPCRFALFHLTPFTDPDAMRAPYDSVMMREGPVLGTVAISSDKRQTWIDYTPHAGALGEDHFAFRMLPGNGLYEVTVKISAPKLPEPSPEPVPSSLFVYFDFDRDALTTDALGALDVVGREMSDPHFRDFNLQIAGHTDAHGAVSYNLALSERRVEAVRTYLASRFGINPARVRSAAFGEAVPIDKDHPYADVNRRVHLTLVRGQRALGVVAP
jgi:outer membrane protein OmpA-like peptidoglycan-associated protein